jgi:hypothetical protein
MYKGKAIALTIFILALVGCTNTLALKDLCPLEDEAFCTFTQEVETALVSGKIDDFMNHFELHDCEKYGGGPYGPVEEGICGNDEWCVSEGVLRGEGSCIPFSQARNDWERFLKLPIFVKGHVYTPLPGYEPEGTFNLEWPGIILETYDPEWNVILLTSKESGEWKISRFLLQRKDNACVQIPPGTVIPWQWPYENNVFYWYGMTIPLDAWRVGSGTGDPESYGVLENRSISGCRFRIMYDVYSYLKGFDPRLDFSRENKETENLRVRINTAEDITISPRIAYFDVEDKTGSRGPSLFRIAYLLVEADEDIEACTGAIYDLLLTMLPERFPELKIPQG